MEIDSLKFYEHLFGKTTLYVNKPKEEETTFTTKNKSRIGEEDKTVKKQHQDLIKDLTILGDDNANVALLFKTEYPTISLEIVEMLEKTFKALGSSYHETQQYLFPINYKAPAKLSKHIKLAIITDHSLAQSLVGKQRYKLYEPIEINQVVYLVIDPFKEVLSKRNKLGVLFWKAIKKAYSI